jgi:transcriptional regulator
MYLPSWFAEERLDVLHDFVRRHGFGALTCADDDGVPQATHLPMLLIPDRGGKFGALQFHVARPNEQGKLLERGSRPALAMFHGPHAYISAAWYTSGAPTVPTWNYLVVHARGVPRILGDEQLAGHLRSLVSAYESPRAQPWDTDRLPPESFAKLRAAVVGFEMEITSIQGKWKLGQNRTRADREGAIAGLREAGDGQSLAIAEAMAAALAASSADSGRA